MFGGRKCGVHRHQTTSITEGETKMRRTGMIFVVAALVILAAGLASAQQGPVISIDENGNGFMDGTRIPWFMGPDPGPGGLPMTLTYRPPLTIAPMFGDLLLLEPDGLLSDIVRFNQDGSIVFYSDLEAADPNKELADVGFPTAYWDNRFVIDELGPEGNNGVVYSPLPGQPGSFPAGVVPVTYRIMSDVIPEPSSIVALLTGMGGLAGLMLRRRK
jgi:hypothetical protein